MVQLYMFMCVCVCEYLSKCMCATMCGEGQIVGVGLPFVKYMHATFAFL